MAFVFGSFAPSHPRHLEVSVRKDFSQQWNIATLLVSLFILVFAARALATNPDWLGGVATLLSGLLTIWSLWDLVKEEERRRVSQRYD